MIARLCFALFVLCALFALALPPRAEAVIRLGSANTVSLASGLVGYWTFDGSTVNWSTGQASDLSGQGNTGALVGMSTTTSPVAGKIGQALQFDGSSSYVSAPSVSFSSDFTFSAWVKLKSNSVSDYLVPIIAKGLWNGNFNGDGAIGIAPANFVQTGAGQWIFNVYNGGINTFIQDPSSATVGSWVYIVGVKQGTNEYLYKNGVQIANGTASGSFSNSPNTVEIGAYPGNEAATALNGDIDDVRVYNRALSANEIEQLYNLGTANLAHANTVNVGNGLVGYWPFDGSTVNWSTGQASDLSGQGNTGALVGMSTTTSPVAGKLGQALSFNGVSSYVSIPGSTQYIVSTNPFTVSAWVYLNNFNNGVAPVITTLRTNTSNPWYLLVASPSASSGAYTGIDLCSGDSAWANLKNNVDFSSNFGGWHHIVATYNGSGSATNANFALYLDGVSQSLVNTGFLCGTAAQASDIGSNANGSGNFWDGKLDDVRIYDRALSASEVQQLYNLGTANIGHANTVNVGNGLVGYWPFDGSTVNWSTGQASDLSGQGNTGALVGMSTTTSPVAGKIGQALQFDGSDYVDAGNGSSLSFGSGAFSVSAWIKPTSGNVGGQIAAKGAAGGVVNGFWFGLENRFGGNPNAIGFTVQGSGTYGERYSSTAQYSPNQWTYVVGVWNQASTLIQLYINGAAVATTYANSNGSESQIGDTDNSCDLIIGAYQNTSCAISGSYHFPGAIDDARVYNRALSASEVQQLYNMGR